MVFSSEDGNFRNVYYKTKTIRPIQYGTYYLQTETGFELQPFLNIPELTEVLLERSFDVNTRKKTWTLLMDMTGKHPHPICGVKLVFGDSEVMQRSVFAKKKWVE